MSDNPADYELAHYGVKGMKWGKRRADKKAARQAENDEIKGARTRIAKKGNKFEATQLSALSESKKGNKAKAAELWGKSAEMEMNILSSPDAATARKLTSGERTTNRLSTGVAIAAAATYVGMRAYANNR